MSAAGDRVMGEAYPVHAFLYGVIRLCANKRCSAKHQEQQLHKTRKLRFGWLRGKLAEGAVTLR